MKRQRPSRGQCYREGKERQYDDRWRWPLKVRGYEDSKRTFTKSNLAGSRMGTDKEFVRRWLVQTEKENEAQESSLMTPQHKHRHREIDQQSQTDFLSSQNIYYQDKNSHPKGLRKRQRRNSSSDSSLLVAGITTKINSPGRYTVSNKYRKEENNQSHTRMECGTETSDTEASGQAINRQEPFEKRPRRKTKEDRYKPKDRKTVSELCRRQKRQSTRGVKKRDEKRAARKLGECLMHNFTSEHIAQDRLTFRPPHCHGLFNNGRGSSSQRRRGLPDLASSEMMFLQRPIHAPATKVQEEAALKSREKERRRAEREQLEISTFFKPRKAALEEVAMNVGRQTSLTFMTEENPTSRKNSLNDCHPGKYIGLLYESSPEHRDLVSGQLAELSDAICTPSCRSYSAKLHGQASGHVGTYPRTEITSVTRSESQISLITTAALDRLRNISELETSPIPDSIRRSIEKTGIFRDTGIESSITFNQARVSLDERTRIEKLQSKSRNRSCSLMVNEGTASPRYLIRPRPQAAQPLNEGHSPRISMSQSHGHKQEVSQQTQAEQSCDKCPPRGEISTVRFQRAIVEQLASNSNQLPGRGKSNPLPILEAFSSHPPRKPISPPMTREQIALQSRIKRPSATVLVSESTQDELLQGENEGRVIQKNSQINQQPTNQPTLHSSKAPTEDFVGPNLAIDNDETGRPSRAGNTKQHIHQALNKESSDMREPNTTLFKVQSTTRSQASNLLDCGCIVSDTPISRDQGSQTPAFDISARSVSNIPVLESSIIWAGGTASHSTCLWQTAQDPKTSVNQFPRMYFLEAEHVPNNKDYMGERYDNQFEEERNAAMPCNDRPKYDIWEQEYVTAAIHDDSCNNDRFYEGMRGLHEYYGIHSTDSELLEALALFRHQELGDSESWAEDDKEKTDPYNLEGINFEGVYNQSLRQDIRYEHLSEEAEDLLRDFWRPQRTY